MQELNAQELANVNGGGLLGDILITAGGIVDTVGTNLGNGVASALSNLTVGIVVTAAGLGNALGNIINGLA